MTAPPKLPRAQRAGPDLLPLAPFLASLESDGIRATLYDHQRIHLALRARGRWTAGRLRDLLAALLARDKEQAALIRRRFEAFFELEDDAQLAFSEVDVERTLADLRVLAEVPAAGPSRPRFLRRRPAGRRPSGATRSRPGRWPLWSALAALAIAGLGFGTWKLRSPPEPPAPALSFSRAEPRGADISDQETAPEPAMRTYQVPVVTAVREVDDPNAGGWKQPAVVATAILLIQLAYGVWLWRLRRPPRDEAPYLNPAAPRLFRTAGLGGDPAPWLDQETLDHFADALGYFRSEESSRKLDVERSIEATGRGGGVPRLVFERRKRVRSVIVLEDALAEPFATPWGNPIAGELARGLARRGVPVIHGVFRGSPARFRTAAGAEQALEDLEDQRRGYLLLIFSDGKGLTRRRDAFTLERLSRWPRVAWMEPRERRAWDENTAFPARHGLPIHPASRHGLMRALGHLATELGPQADFDQDTDAWRGGPTATASGLGGHDLERLLGDALPWVQSCSMMVPPLSPGLADALRRRFHAGVPPERVERLRALPGLTATGAGLRFSRRLLALLRRGFLARNDQDRQRQVIEFLIAEVRAAEPEDQDSLEHHVWQWKLERLRLEIDPDRALRRLAELARGPLGSSISGELDGVSVKPRAGAPVEQEAVAEVPLRARPASRRGLQRLLRLAARSGVSRREAYPVGRGHRVALTVLGGLWIAFGLTAGWRATYRWPTAALSWDAATAGSLWIEKEVEDRWQRVTMAALVIPGSLALDRGAVYRVRLLGAGYETWPETTRNLGRVDRDLELDIGLETRKVPCREIVSGQAVERCLPAAKGRRAGDRIVEPAIDMALRYVPAGTFMMGSPEDESYRDDDEALHQVELTRGFWIGETEVTQGQWRFLMGSEPARFENCGDDCPVESVSWYDVVTFANLLSARADLRPCYVLEGCAGTLGGGCAEGDLFCRGDYSCDAVNLPDTECKGYRLPTEAEWEYAARAGTSGPFSTGGNLTTDQANYDGNYPYAGQPKGVYRKRTVPVQSFQPNPWGLSEVHGNVWEWTGDWFGEYGTDLAVDPLGVEEGSYRVARGGSWRFHARYCRSAIRRRSAPGNRGAYVGFRLVRTSD